MLSKLSIFTKANYCYECQVNRICDNCEYTKQNIFLSTF